MSAVLPSPAPAVHLTKREGEVLVLLGKGCSNKAIGRLLEVSPHTVGDYMKTIFRHLNVHSRTEAAVWAVKAGML